MGFNTLCFSLSVFASFVITVNSHGRMIDPPSRASMWRYGFDNPKDYNDNQGFCGGAQNQWKVHMGKCGVCGDPYQGPRLHEPGKDNKYANGIIVKEYKSHEVIKVTIQITAHHKGYFEFRLSPSEDNLGKVSQTSLNRYVLELKGGGTRYYLPNSGSGNYNVQLLLPAGLTCRHCVLQWIYHTGNSWGCDPDGTCGLGLGGQEEFRACADVRIVSEDGKTPTAPDTKPPTTPQPTSKSSTTSVPSPPSTKKTTVQSTTRTPTGAPTTRTPPTGAPTTRAPTTGAPTTRAPTTRIPTSRKPSTSTPTMPSSTVHATTMKRVTTAQPATLGPKKPTKQCASSSGSVCSWKSAGPWKGQRAMDDWCSTNCPGPACNGWEGCDCKCEDEEPFQLNCMAAGAWEGDTNMDQWCSWNCPGYCPPSHCKCNS